MFTKAQGIVNICGDYVAFHEMSVYSEYLFGDLFSTGDKSYEVLMESLKLDWNSDNPLEKQDKKVLDSIMKEWIDDYESIGEYHDYAMRDCVVETDNNGKVLEVYWNV